MLMTLVGKEYQPFVFEVEKGRIRMFAQAIGDTNPIYHDAQAAANAGYSAIPAPPTFPFTIIMEANQAFMILEELGIDKTRTMHGEQSFTYHGDICAGDIITGRQKVVDQYEKKGGALQFIVTQIQLTNQRQEHVCDLNMTIVIRNV
ncbi:MAG: MaoC family dehydratase N-terminal domain-containing protein [Rhodocyclaceae bacterium]|jgi:acyl dehydratase|nr:MaoC family dehydratase N-terminal domain-containing protein [Rhodocyclaceae bacterium]MBK7812836.1 MaoC family dehydratase N-terminal domain-containing protein [Rhodocyclaceae bacterium]